MTTVTISLPESLRDFVEGQVKHGGYGNVSEYFRSLLREAREIEEERRIETLLIEGLESGGADIEIDPEYLKRKRRAILSRIAERKPRSGKR